VIVNFGVVVDIIIAFVAIAVIMHAEYSDLKNAPAAFTQAIKACSKSHYFVSNEPQRRGGMRPSAAHRSHTP
jgi:hypothetical protein